MTVYLASPRSQQQAEHLENMPVLLSYAIYPPWLDAGNYTASFSRILVDSGAFSEMNSGKVIDVAKYRDWSQQWIGQADAIAGVDDIRGDWKKSLRNYAQIEWSFPTWHDSDPLALLDELVPMAQERGGWLGIGLVPPRQGKEHIIRKALSRVPPDLHIHGWACRRYTHIRRINSVDATSWRLDAQNLMKLPELRHLTVGECMEIMVKRYQRWDRVIKKDGPQWEKLL